MLILLLGVASAAVSADQRDVRLDGLFTSLAKAKSIQESAKIEAGIWRIWAQTDKRKVAQIYAQGLQAMHARKLDQAIKLFSQVIKLQPVFAEAWNKRATILYMQHKLAQSVVDIEKTLALEPRHFGALSGMGLIFLARDDTRGALQAFERVLEINPLSVSARINVEWLRKKLDIHGA